MTFVEPNAHKEWKLQETCDMYRRALQTAFEADYHAGRR